MRPFSEEVVPHQTTIEAYGVQVRVCVSTPELMEAVKPLFPPGSRSVKNNMEAKQIGIVDEEDGTYSVYIGANRGVERGTLDLAMVVFEDQIESFVAVNARGVIFVHAGVVAHESAALMIPGDSFSGKSTLVEALVRQGALYFSDEFAVVDEEGLVHPYARSLQLRHYRVPGGHPRSGERTVESLGGTAGDRPLALGLAVVTHFVPGAEWRPRRLSHGEAVLALMAKTVPARHRPQEAMRALSRAVNGAIVLEGERGEAEEFASMLLEGAVA